MGPPATVLPSSGTIASPGGNSSPAASNMSTQLYNGPAPGLMLATQPGQPGMVESPKPLSPQQPGQHRLSIAEAANMRNRSPSLTTQFQQQHFGRSTGQGTPPIPSHAPPQHAPHLPSLPGIHSETVRLGHQTRLPIAPPGPSMLQHQYPSGPPSNPGSMSSHGRSSGASLRELAGGTDDAIWNYMRNLEQRFSRMQDEYDLRISRMQEEIISLKQHINTGSR